MRYTRSNFPKFARAARVIGTAYKAYKSRTATKSRSSPKSGLSGITTFQKDVKQVYRFKRAPARVRSRARRSQRAFTSNLLKAEGSRKYHYSGNMVWTTAQGQQNFFGWMNYGANGNGGVDGSGDIADIYIRMDAENRGAGTSADQAERGEAARRFYFDHMRGRVILTNTGTTPIFWEIYECVARKDIPLAEGAALEPFLGNCFAAGYQGTLSGTAGAAANTPKQTSAVTLPTRYSPGITPFQLRHFCQNWKINKVTRLQAAAGNTVSFDASMPRNLVMNWDNYANMLAKKGVTRQYLVRQWGTVELISGVPTNSSSSAVCEIERDYNVKMLDSHVPQLNYMTYANTTI